MSKKVMKLIRDYFNLAKDYPLTPHTKICDLGGSYDAINFSFMVEQKHGIEFTDQEGYAIETGTIGKIQRILTAILAREGKRGRV